MGRKRIDLTGQKFGRLTVIGFSHTGNNKHSYWDCCCSCGNSIKAFGPSLKSGHLKSCGCIKADKKVWVSLNIIGKVFGKLTVLEIGLKGKDKRTYWRCKCFCGKEVIIRADGVKSGHSKSCGCMFQKYVYERGIEDLRGQRFGKLTVLKFLHIDKHRQVCWDCLCDCGSLKIVTSSHLRSGATKSCGCYNSAEKISRHSNILKPEDVPIELIRLTQINSKITKHLKERNQKHG